MTFVVPEKNWPTFFPQWNKLVLEYAELAEKYGERAFMYIYDRWSSQDYNRHFFAMSARAYDVEKDAFTDALDLRFMGSLRDAALDVLVPLHRAISTGPVYNGLRIRKNLLKWAVRGLIQCSACRLGIDTPWIFCPRDGCLRSGSYSQ